MVNLDNLCMGCMKTTNGEATCPYCGFSRSEYEKNRNPRALPVFTILNGKYLVGKVLGDGGFGITYLAYDLNLSIPRAIKEYFPTGLVMRDNAGNHTETVSLTSSDNRPYFEHGLQSFAEEAKNLAKFQDMDGIVSVTDFFFENATAYLVMEYIDGQTLRQYLKDSSLSELETLQLMYPVLRSLSEIHKNGMVHRDVSPDNIMLSTDGKIYLIDFGAARVATGEATKSITIQLKHGYAPLEQYETKGRQGPWTDIYAVCATMYRMMSGKVPDAATDRSREDHMVPLEELSIANDEYGISTRVSRVIEKGMAVQAEDRYQSVEELMRDLYGAETPKKPNPNPGNPSGKKKTNMGLQILIAVCTVGMLLVTGYCVLKSTGYLPSSDTETSAEAESEPVVTDTPESARDKKIASLDRAQIVMASVSSMLDASSGNSPVLMFDDDANTVWQEAGTDGEDDRIIRAEFDREYEVSYLVLRLGNWKSEEAYQEYNRPKKLKIMLGDTEFEAEVTDSREECYLEVDPAVTCSDITVQSLEVYKGDTWNVTCITDILVYGK